MIAIQSVTDDSSTNDVLDWIFYYGKENILRLNDEISIDSISIDNEINVSYNNNDFNPLNVAYKSYPIKYAEIIDVWKFTCALATVESEPDNLDNLNFKEIVTELRKDIIEIKRKL